MVLIVLAVIGIVLGYRLGLTRRAFAIMIAAAAGAALFEAGHLGISSDPSRMTTLPLVVGAVVVTSMLFGALVKLTASHAGKAS